MAKKNTNKEQLEQEIKSQKWSDKKIDDFIKNYGEINKYNLESFKELFAHEYQVERLLYINNKVFRYKEKTSIEQIVAQGGVIIPYKQGVGNVTINQRVNLLEGDMTEVKSRLGVLEGDVKELKFQMTDMKIQITEVSSKIDKLTELLTEHIKNHKQH